MYTLCLFLNADFDTLTKLVKCVSHKVVEGGGIVRSIRNHGIRDLPHRFRAKFPDTQGNRYYTKGRFISVYYDASPGTMRQVESVISMDDTVLRQTHLKARSKLDFVNHPKQAQNPYMKRVLREEEELIATTEGTVEHLQALAEETIDDLESLAQETVEELEAEAVETIDELEANAAKTVEEEAKEK
jgi:small subunit ribosomal protein S6